MITTSDIKNAGEIRALWWRNPFAALMLHGKYETRTWPTKYRGLVLICASKQPYRPADLINICPPEDLNRMPGILSNEPAFKMSGCAIAIGRLVDCYTMKDMISRGDGYAFTDIHEKTFVKYDPEKWVHEYADVTRITPFQIAGAQKWRILQPDTINKIRIA